MAAEAERDAQERTHARLTWIKRESGAEKAGKARQERSGRAAARPPRPEREAQQRLREQATWVKEETAASRQAESASQSKKLKDERLSRIKARHARRGGPREQGSVT